MVARSVSRSVLEKLQREARCGTVLAVFRRAWALLLPGDDVVALVLPEVDDGPLNIVVEGNPGDYETLQPGMRAQLSALRIRVAGLELSLDGARIWEPCPAWNRLRPCCESIRKALDPLKALALHDAPGDSLLSLLLGEPQSILPRQRALYAVVRQAADALQGGWDGDCAQLETGAAGLAGLGGGLTPAGDDFLAGVMLWAWLDHPEPQPFCDALLSACAGRTTILSAAFLRAAAAGECPAPWHRLLLELAPGGQQQIAPAVWDVLACGHTSGADSLAGFLWMGLRS